MWHSSVVYFYLISLCLFGVPLIPFILQAIHLLYFASCYVWIADIKKQQVFTVILVSLEDWCAGTDSGLVCSRVARYVLVLGVWIRAVWVSVSKELAHLSTNGADLDSTLRPKSVYRLWTFLASHLIIYSHTPNLDDQVLNAECCKWLSVLHMTHPTKHTY